MKRALAAVLLAAACGSGTDGKPVAPPTTPEPPARPPTVQAVAALWSKPAIGDGYSVGERVRVVLDFELHTTTVEGSPRLAIQIGEHVRLADFSPWVEDDFPPERPSRLQRFEYKVGPDDADSDGISIEADALDFSDGAIRGREGGEIRVEIRAVDPQGLGRNLARPGEALDTHRVIGPPEPRVCTDERQRAAAFSRGAILVDEWDGTPFRIDMVRNFPDSVEDLERLLQPVELLDQQIEEQLGYRIVEMGTLIPWRPAPSGSNCTLRRERGQALGYFFSKHTDKFRAGANPLCADFVYTRQLMAEWCPQCEEHPRTQGGQYFDAITLHEIFHLFGFNHNSEFGPDLLDRGGVEMSLSLTTSRLPEALWEDIDLLRCIFPEGG